MKVYRSTDTGTYFEKQEDVRLVHGKKFEAVEFPFAASPKADFVYWLNGQQQGLYPGIKVADIRQDIADHEGLMGLAPIVGIAQPLPAQPDPAHAARSIAMEDAWENLPFGQKAHFASLFCEEAREKIK